MNNNDPSGKCIWDACIVETAYVVGAILIGGATAYAVDQTMKAHPTGPNILSTPGSRNGPMINSTPAHENGSEVLSTPQPEAIPDTPGFTPDQQGPIVLTQDVAPSTLYPTQSRGELTGNKVKKLTKEMRANGTVNIPPIKVSRTPSGRMYIVDGHHRATAAQKAGVRVPAKITDVGYEEADKLRDDYIEAIAKDRR